MSLAVQLEPVLGPLLGFAFGVAAAPGMFTWIGGSVVLLATLGATLATAKRQQQEEEAESRRVLKHKSMRLPSFVVAGGGGGDGNGSNSSYAALTAQEDSFSAQAAAGGGNSNGSRGISIPQWKQSGIGNSSSSRMSEAEGDMDVVVGERQQLLPGGSQLSHHVHVRPAAGVMHHQHHNHNRDHSEIEMQEPAGADVQQGGGSGVGVGGSGRRV